MLPKFRPALLIFLMAGSLGLLCLPPGVLQVYAAPEDVALFQDVLANYGQWLDHGQHGPVWRPSQVSRTWRPYTNGRWVPTQEGYVFETEEPWGWATYHYGNWVSSNEHGWVWVPGRTWYPHTVDWRTNDENVGWAPVPPPESTSYTGSDTLYSEGYGPTSSPNTYGYSSPGSLSSLWVFTRAADFLLGYGQPYSPGYSYAYSGVMLAPQYIPVVYERTVVVNNYVYPSYAPRACYNWGPPPPYIARVTHHRNFEHDHRHKNFRPGHLRNVMPPGNLVHRHPAWREILPKDGAGREGHIRPVAGHRPASRELNRPDAIPAPSSLPRRSAERASRPDSSEPFKAPIAAAAPAGSQGSPGKMVESPNGRRGPGNMTASRPVAPGQAQEQKNSSTAARLPYPNVGQTSIPAATSSGRTAEPQTPAVQSARQIPPHRGYPREVQTASQENQMRRQKDQRLLRELPPAVREHRERPQDVPPYEPQQARRQQQMELERQRRHAESQRPRQIPPPGDFQRQPPAQPQRQAELLQQQKVQQQAEKQRQDQMQQHRQAEMTRQQQQAEIQRQAQVQQQRQADMQRQQQAQQERQAEMQRQQQMQQQRQADMVRQQQQVVRQAPPPPPPPRQAPPPQRQKKHDNQ